MEATKLNSAAGMGDSGNLQKEDEAVWESAGVFDLSSRGRLCLAGGDRVRFLHGQVTNDVKGLRVGEGCYAALITAKGKMQSDLNVYCLPEELLLDFEPGLTAIISQRLEKYVIADDVQIIDVAGNYGLLTVQGPKSASVIRALGIGDGLPGKPFGFARNAESAFGEIHLMNQPRLGTTGYDLLVPVDGIERAKKELIVRATAEGG